VSDDGAATARERLLRPGVDVTPRRMWPTGMKDLGVAASGKIPPAQGAEPGRALGRLTDVGWGTRLRALLADGAPDEPAGSDLIGALIKVLAAWDWADRPVAMVTMASNTRPLLIESLGKALADIGRLPYLGSLAYTGGGPGPRRHNSAQRLRTVWDAFTVPAPLGQAVAEAGGPVLLIDDRIESGWTMTVAARLLREAGAPAVLPLALAVTTG
jgi:ATP-dependent DNA helicase RecQ